MTFILTNDDGIDAKGINALEKALGNENIVMIAPNRQYSGCGHQMTVRTPISVDRRNDRAYAVNGTPVDCVRLGVTQFSPDCEWVLSGINSGGNLGVDIYLSGTVAAVREAAILGKRGIAISQTIKSPLKIDWDWTTMISKKVLDFLLTQKTPSGCFWNVNLPHLPNNSPEPKMIFCDPSIDSLHFSYKKEDNLYSYQGKYHDRKKTQNTDVCICFEGNIAISLISLHYKQVINLESIDRA